MSYWHFGNFVESLSDFDNHLAMTVKPFIKIEHLSYLELRQNIYRSANYLSSKGIKPGHKIMIIGANSPQWVEIFLGAQLLGITIVPIDARSNLETVLNYAKKVKPNLVYRDKYTLVELDSHFDTCTIEDFNNQIAIFPNTPPTYKIKGNETALIVFTSGTTASPKGVVLSQRNILSNVFGVQQALTIDPDWRFLSVLPLSHMYELTGGCLAPLSSGASIFYIPRVTPLAIAKGLQEYQITTILAVPQLLTLFLQRIRQNASAHRKSLILSSALMVSKFIPFRSRRLLFKSVHNRLGGKLSLVVTGGAPIPLEVAEAWEHMGVKAVQGYGLTETSPVIAVNNPNDRRLDSQGKVLGNVHLKISKSTSEILVKGPSVFSNYWNDKIATKAAFTEDGWFKTGDIGSLDGNWLQIKGREKFAIVLSSGLKVFPEDIELEAERHTELGSVCIVGIKKPDGEKVEAVIISNLTDEKISNAVNEINSKLESFQHINGWSRWPEQEFPRTRLLKIDRKFVQDWANTRKDSSKIEDDNKSKPTIDPLIKIIRLSLDEPKAQIKENDALANIGLDSLRRMTVTSLIEEQLSINISELQINQKTTLSDLRKLVSAGTPSETPSSRTLWTFWPSVRLLGNGARETLVRGLLRIWIKQHTVGRDNIVKKSGPALYIFNHVDDFDVPVLYKGLPVQVRNNLAIAAADDVLLEHKLLAFIARFCFAGFNFARKDPFMPSLEYVADLIDKGWNVALAPEGKLSINGGLLPFKSGIGLLAVELGVPVIPVKTFGLTGTVPLHAKWPKKHSTVIVRIGEPMHFDKDLSYDDATQQLYDAMRDLKPH